MKKHINPSSYLIFLFLLFATCTESSSPLLQGNISIIPQPQQTTILEGFFILNKNTHIALPNEEEDWKNAAHALIEPSEKSTGHLLKIKPESASIIFKIDKTIAEQEGYRLSVNTEQITIAAPTAQGAFYGVQTLLQLMPTDVFNTKKTIDLNFKIPAVDIKDAPRFAYRGMHLDVARHFFNVDEVKRYIDLMAMHKYNRFHWHLTEDQGWRIEIKQYPKLTEVGAFRKETLIGHYSDQPHQFDGKRYGGFYTQEEVKEVIAHAKKRFVTIIPEIELPGHAQAAIAAYPELGCTGDSLEVMTLWGISKNVYCPTEATFTFLENVLEEVMDLFPGEYIHIGGDECPKKQWKASAFCQKLIRQEGLKDELELQSFFIKKIEKFINAKSKRMIGWDEILEGGLAPNATVMSWRGMKGGIRAANAGHDVIMTPTSHCYFDYYQSRHADEPVAIGGYLPLEKVYSFEPIPRDIADDKKQHIIGAQANLWTEYIPTVEHLDYMAYPRATAMAEVLWSKEKQRDFKDFSERLKWHFNRLNALGVQAATNFYDTKGEVISEQGVVKVALQSPLSGAIITYTLDGSSPTLQSTVYTAPFEIKTSAEIKAATFLKGIQKGKTWTNDIKIHKAVGKKITLSSKPSSYYNAGGKDIIINGIYGHDSQFNDKEWLGFNAQDFEAVIDLGTEMEFSKVGCRFFKGEGAWIFLPKKMSVWVSNDGENFELAGATTDIVAEKNVASPSVKIGATARYVKVVAKRYGLLPAWHAGAGKEGWVFVGEVELW